MKKIVAWCAGSLLALSGVAFASVGIAQATNQPATAGQVIEQTADDACALTTSDFAAIQAIQNDPTLTPSEELTQELALRKQLLGQTISCATTEAQALKATVDGISTDQSGTAIKAELSGKLADTINFYNIESAKLNGAGISATEAIAKEMGAWRTANYLPIAENANNFILWAKNQPLFTTAENRLAQTQRVVSFIENAANGDEDLAPSLSAAGSSLNDALDENRGAGTALNQLLPADQTLALIQQSLQSLADAYQHFSDLNKAIQTLLPTTSDQ